jgi:hypothetical protein
MVSRPLLPHVSSCHRDCWGGGREKAAHVWAEGWHAAAQDVRRDSMQFHRHTITRESISEKKQEKTRPLSLVFVFGLTFISNCLTSVLHCLFPVAA